METERWKPKYGNQKMETKRYNGKMESNNGN